MIAVTVNLAGRPSRSGNMPFLHDFGSKTAGETQRATTIRYFQKNIGQKRRAAENLHWYFGWNANFVLVQKMWHVQVLALSKRCIWKYDAIYSQHLKIEWIIAIQSWKNTLQNNMVCVSLKNDAGSLWQSKWSKRLASSRRRFISGSALNSAGTSIFIMYFAKYSRCFIASTCWTTHSKTGKTAFRLPSTRSCRHTDLEKQHQFKAGKSSR